MAAVHHVIRTEARGLAKFKGEKFLDLQNPFVASKKIVTIAFFYPTIIKETYHREQNNHGYVMCFVTLKFVYLFSSVLMFAALVYL